MTWIIELNKIRKKKQKLERYISTEIQSPKCCPNQMYILLLQNKPWHGQCTDGSLALESYSKGGDMGSIYRLHIWSNTLLLVGTQGGKKKKHVILVSPNEWCSQLQFYPFSSISKFPNSPRCISLHSFKKPNGLKVPPQNFLLQTIFSSNWMS